MIGVWGTDYIGYSTIANFAANGVKSLGSDIHMVAIPTEKEDGPWDGALRDVTEKIAKVEVEPNSPPIVIIESTLTPNKTDQLVIPTLESAGLKVGTDVLVGVAPRRDCFTSPEKNLKNLPRVVGGTVWVWTKEIFGKGRILGTRFS